MFSKQYKCQNGYMSLATASEKWNLPIGAVKQFCKRVHKNHPYDISVIYVDRKYQIKTDRVGPNDEELFDMGWEFPKNCITVFSFFRVLFRNNINKVRLIVCNLATVIAFFAVDALNNREGYVIYTFLLNSFLSTVFVTCALTSDGIENKLDRMDEAFLQNKDGGYNYNFKSYCNLFYEWINFPFVTERLRQKGKCHGCNMPERKSMPCIVYTTFIVIWTSMVCWILWYTFYNTPIYQGCSGYLFMVLFFFTMIFLSQSCYIAFVQLAFLQGVSGLKNRTNLNEYKYNTEMPSQTTGLIQLLDVTNNYVLLYLTSSTLISLSYLLLLYFGIYIKGAEVSNNPLDLILFLVIFLFAIVSTLVINYGPKLMLRRILKSWVTEERRYLENELYKFQDELEHIKFNKLIIYNEQNCKNRAKNLKEDISDICNKIRQLETEKISLNDDYLQLALTALNLAAPVVTVVLTLFGH